jgi:hypothetical protein
MSNPIDIATIWLAAHPRWTCAVLCALIIGAGRLDAWLP